MGISSGWMVMGSPLAFKLRDLNRSAAGLPTFFPKEAAHG